ncbi:hypothetical protein BBR47_23920 [Brevibacillus brevis NBRC 100599]|uniref:Uncharacterized protein n=1 Tax=Brevibacillus brevis (strain 47 / JCM 6285 / NBRC 100599) TaxID=358681 RepID=C0ZC60_BREBN|nr:hypothetical protein BBR47_23920 [Brevibacillus brevis NBRC 100599]
MKGKYSHKNGKIIFSKAKKSLPLLAEGTLS